MDDLYQEHIVDHYQNPRNFKELENADLVVRESNASCGDLVQVWVKLDESKQKVIDISFKGVGCAVSTAAASMLVEKVKEEQLSLEQLEDLSIANIKELLGIEITPTRSKCALLIVRALRKVALTSD